MDGNGWEWGLEGEWMGSATAEGMGREAQRQRVWAGKRNGRGYGQGSATAEAWGRGFCLFSFHLPFCQFGVWRAVTLYYLKKQKNAKLKQH